MRMQPRRRIDPNLDVTAIRGDVTGRVWAIKLIGGEVWVCVSGTYYRASQCGRAGDSEGRAIAHGDLVTVRA